MYKCCPQLRFIILMVRLYKNLTFILHHHHQPVNVPNAGAQAYGLHIRRTGHNPPPHNQIFPYYTRTVPLRTSGGRREYGEAVRPSIPQGSLWELHPGGGSAGLRSAREQRARRSSPLCHRLQRSRARLRTPPTECHYQSARSEYNTYHSHFISKEVAEISRIFPPRHFTKTNYIHTTYVLSPKGYQRHHRYYETPTFNQNYLAMRNTTDVSGKPIAV
jgi:hypothetical protein